MKLRLPRRLSGPWLLVMALLVVATVYLPGLSGSWLFDDYPNIVDNHGVQPHDASMPSLVRAALSSPSSELKRPLASLSFAANYLAAGLHPSWWKFTNLIIHLLNGLLVFVLARALLRMDAAVHAEATSGSTSQHAGITAALIAAGWMLLPINLTGVLYVVQRMESMANLFVLTGLIGYVAGRRRMLGLAAIGGSKTTLQPSRAGVSRGFWLCLISVTVPTAVGILAKETAVMLPLYALLIEWILFGFRRPAATAPSMSASNATPTSRRDQRIIVLFMLVLVVPMLFGLAWLLPSILNPQTWSTRDFNLTTRLLSEMRIIVAYIAWTLLPTPDALSFYHDDFHISSGLLAPWTTLASIVFLAGLIALMLRLRRRWPLVSLGIALFLGCQLLTGTILPLELIYEHRNYFASFGLLLAVVPLLTAPPNALEKRFGAGLPMALPRHVLLVGLMVYWATLTAVTAYAWGNPLRLAETLALRAPQSPRAQYELGRTFIINSHYDPFSPFTRLAYAPLERAAALPDSSILPEQALIFMNSRMHLPLKNAWWDSLISKLTARKPGVQDVSSLSALVQCARVNDCDLPKSRMTESFKAALSHPAPSARLLAIYGDYAWNVQGDHVLGLRMIEEAVRSAPEEPAYQVTLIRMLVAQERTPEARIAFKRLEILNIGGRLDQQLTELQELPGWR